MLDGIQSSQLNVKTHAMDNGTVIVVSTKGSPKIKAHIDGIVAAQVAISHDTSTRDTILGDGDCLATE